MKLHKEVHPAVSYQSLGLPKPVLHSPLMDQGGFMVLETLVSRSYFDGMLRESDVNLRDAWRTDVSVPDDTEWRGGSPARAFFSSLGGEAQEAFYHDDEVLDLLDDRCKAVVVPASARGSYTYYASPGDHLGLHRDIDVCDLALITCLKNSVGRNGAGGQLRLYPNRILEPLSSISQTPDVDAIDVMLEPGESCIILGGAIAHRVLPVLPSQNRVVSILCYRLQTG